MSRYSSDDLKKAVSAFRKRHMTLKMASIEFNVPKTTIYDQASGRHSGPRGRSTDMNKQEEQALVSFILFNADRGFPMSRHMIRCYIKETVRRYERLTRINHETGPPDQWFRNFYKRHPELSEKAAENMDAGRTQMSNATTMEKWFNFLGKVLEDEGLKNLPDRLISTTLDDCFLEFCTLPGSTRVELRDYENRGRIAKAKVVGRKGGHTFKQKMGVSSHITALLCVCADGRFLPTMLIFQGSLPHREFKDGLPSSWLYASSESGYMNGDLFLAWFKSCFLKYCTKKRPVCLIMDNHDSHITLPLVEAAKENNVILIGLPGHTTHILQPLDVKIIGPLKSRCATIAERCGFVNNSFNISKARFPLILNYAIDQTTPSSVKEAFRATGICPLDGSAIDKSQIVPATFAKPTTATEENNDDNDARTCPTCGAFAANPLVQQGLVPQHLADVLMPTPSQPLSSQKKKRVVAEGRVISGDEMLHKLKEREAAVLAKKERQEERKKKRILKDEKENKKKEIKIMKKKSGDVQGTLKLKKHIVSGQKSSAEKAVITRDKGLASVIYTCGVCGVRGRKDDEVNGIEWVGCDEEMCLSCFHLDCLSESEREYVRESLADDTDWYCKMCKPWLYEEE